LAPLATQVAENAKDLAIQGSPRKELYLTGKMGDKPISLHSEGTKVVLTDEEGSREEVDLSAGGRRATSEAGGEEAPGTSPLDGVLADLATNEAAEPEPDPEPDDAATKDADGKEVS